MCSSWSRRNCLCRYIDYTITFESSCSLISSRSSSWTHVLNFDLLNTRSCNTARWTLSHCTAWLSWWFWNSRITRSTFTPFRFWCLSWKSSTWFLDSSLTKRTTNLCSCLQRCYRSLCSRKCSLNSSTGSSYLCFSKFICSSTLLHGLLKTTKEGLHLIDCLPGLCSITLCNRINTICTSTTCSRNSFCCSTNISSFLNLCRCCWSTRCSSCCCGSTSCCSCRPNARRCRTTSNYVTTLTHCSSSCCLECFISSTSAKCINKTSNQCCPFCEVSFFS